MRIAAVITVVLFVALIPFLGDHHSQQSFCLPYRNSIVVCQERAVYWSPLAFVAGPSWWINR